MDQVLLSINFEKAVRMLMEHMPESEANSRKPIAFHDIRVGVYLFEHGYSADIVLAGVLHDMIEWSSATQQMVRDEFGDSIVQLVLASTKDDSILDKEEKTKELIRRCIANGQDALIVKAADILDSFKWYASQNNEGELRYCMRNANAIFEYKPESFDDKIFQELAVWREEYVYLMNE